MATTVIERLVVGLSADPAALARGLSAAGGMVKNFASGVMSAMTPLGVAAGGLLAAGFAGGLDKAATSIKSIGASLGAMGVSNASSVVAGYSAFAAEMEKVSTSSRSATLSLLDQAGALGLFGKQAENATFNALALADGNADAARSYMQLTAALQRGSATPEMLAEGLGLKGEKSPAVLMDAMTKRIQAGQERMGNSANSAAGQVTKLRNAFGEFATEAGGAAAAILGPALGWMTKALNAFREASPEVKRWTGTILVGLAGVAAAGPVMSALSPVVGLVTSAFGMLGSAISFTVGKVLIGIPVWAAYKAATIAASVATAVFTGTQKLGLAGTIAYYGAMILLSPVLLTVKAAMMAVSVATTVSTNAMMMLSGVLMTGTIVGAAASFLAIGAAVTGIATAAYGVYGAVTSTFGLLTSLSSQALAPLRAVGEMIGSWGTILSTTFRALVAGEFSLVGEMLTAGFRLAVSQVSDLLPPLWTALKSGFDVTVRYFVAAFDHHSTVMLNNLQYRFENLFGGGIDVKAMNEASAQGLKDLTRMFGREFSNLGDAFSKSFVTSDATKNAQAEIDRLLGKAGKLPSIGDSIKRIITPGSIGAPWDQGVKSIQAYQHALMGTLDAQDRYADYARRFGLDTTTTTRLTVGTPGQGSFTSAPNPSGISGGAALPTAGGTSATTTGGGSDVASAIRDLIKVAQRIEANTRETADNTADQFDDVGL